MARIGNAQSDRSLTCGSACPQPQRARFKRDHTRVCQAARGTVHRSGPSKQTMGTSIIMVRATLGPFSSFDHRACVVPRSATRSSNANCFQGYPPASKASPARLAALERARAAKRSSRNDTQVAPVSPHFPHTYTWFWAMGGLVAVSAIHCYQVLLIGPSSEGFDCISWLQHCSDAAIHAPHIAVPQNTLFACSVG